MIHLRLIFVFKIYFVDKFYDIINILLNVFSQVSVQYRMSIRLYHRYA